METRAEALLIAWQNPRLVELHKHKEHIPAKVYEVLERRGFTTLRPCQVKAIKAGLFEEKNLLVCTPTASGKTLVGELTALNAILHERGKAVYLVPLRALAMEKHRQFTRDYPSLKIGVSSGDIDSADEYLIRYDVIIATCEKFDSLLRHKASWVRQVKTVIIDEIHLLNDASRGPTLEVVITILRELLPTVHLIGLSATIGNPEELAAWLGAELVLDSWRPVELRHGVLVGTALSFKK